MPSVCTSSETSVSDLLGDQSPAKSGLDVGSWAARDSAQAACAEACNSPSTSESDGLNSNGVLQLRLEVATSQLSDQKARIRGLESTVRELQARLGQAAGRDEGAHLSQAVLVQRIQQLEAALAASKQAEQERAAQLARLEGRAAVAEGSLKATEQQLGQGLSELQAGHAATLAAQREQHACELAAERQRHEAATSAAKIGWEERLQELAADKAAAEAMARREQQRVRELQVQLEKEGSKHEAVRELMRHSEALQSQVDRLQAAAQEDRRRTSKAAQAAEAAVQQERQLAGAAAQEAQQRMQEAGRECDKAVRQARAKQQRAEAELRGPKQQVGQLVGQVQELEALNAKKDLQLDTAVQQVSLMQHELEALRQGLSGRQAATMEAARGEYAAALASCHKELETAKAKLSGETLKAQRQGQALASILCILAVHAGEQASDAGSAYPATAPGTSNANGDGGAVAAAAPDPAKVVAFVEAVSSSMLDVQQQWELEKGEMAAALEVAEAVHAQLGELLERERLDNRGMAGDAAEMAAALQGMEAELEVARQQLHEMDAAKAARAAADAALEACRSELAAAAAKAAAAGDNVVKWEGVVAAAEARMGQLSADAEEARRDAQAARQELETKDGRIAEMRSAMAAAMEDRSSSAACMSSTLTQVQVAASVACQLALRHLQAALVVLGEDQEPQAQALVVALQAAAGLLRGLPPAESELSGCVGALGGAVAQLAAGYAHVATMTQEREKVHHILSSVNSQLQAATVAYPSHLQAAGAPVNAIKASSSSPTAAAGAAGAGGSLSLVDLLQQLTQTVVGLVEGLAVEKECLESQMLHATDETQQLRSQLQSMQAVLASLQSHTALEHQDALLALEQARLRLAVLQQENDELVQRAQQAQHAADTVRASATREWSSMRDDLSSLVQQAEQAQMTADSTCQRQREEYEERLARAVQQGAEAAAGQAAAEAVVDRLQRELIDARQELVAAEQQGMAREEALRGGLQARHADVQELEAKLMQLQKQLAMRARKGGISAAPAKKAAAACSAAGTLKRENERLRAQVEGLQEQVRLLERNVQKGVQQLRQAKELSDAAQRTIANAEGRAARAEALLRKVDERKAAVEVERRRASEAADRLEQQVLELQSRLEAAQHRERTAQAEAEKLRVACSKRETDGRQLSGALVQLEVAEAALRDSQGTAARLLQDCTNLQRENRRLGEEEQQLTLQLQDAHAEAAMAADQVQDLQATLDSVITELEIARSLLANQRHQEQQQLEREGERGRHRANSNSPFFQQLVAYPVRVESLRFNPELCLADVGERSAQEEAMDNVLGTRDTNVRTQRHSSTSSKLGTSSCSQPGQQCRPVVDGSTSTAWVTDTLPSPLTQQGSLQTPGTPAALRQGATPAAAHMADDPSSRGVTPESLWPIAAEGAVVQHIPVNAHQQQQQAGQQGASGTSAAAVAAAAGSRPTSGVESMSRPNSATSAAAAGAIAVDVSDVRRLVGTVESLQRQLAVKNDRIKQLRAAVQQGAASGASFTLASSRPGSAAAGCGSQVFVLEQQLQAAQQQVESLRALSANLERQLGVAQQVQQVQQQVQAQLARISCQLAALLADGGGTQGSLPSTSGDAAGVLCLQAHQLEQLAARVSKEVERSRRDLAAAKQQGSMLQLQLASRSALVDALQSQLRTPSGSGSGGSGCRAHDAAQTEALLMPPLAQLANGANSAPAAAASDEALGSLDRIVALWRQACAAKDDQLQQLCTERDQAQDGLSRAQIELEALTATAQELAEQQQLSSSMLDEVQQRLADAEQRAVAAQAEEQVLAVRCAELEAALLEAREAAEAEGGAVLEARQGQAAAEQQACSLEQQLHIAEAQVRELQHAVQLEQLSHSDAAAQRQQAAALKADLAAARDEAVAAHQEVAKLQQRLSQQQDATQAVADGSTSALVARLDAARLVEQQLLRQMQDLQAAMAAAVQQGEEAGRAAAAKAAEAGQLQECLDASRQQLQEALETVGQQSAALDGLQAALEQRQQEVAAGVEETHGQLARQLATTQHELSLARQEAAVAQKQAEVLRAQVAKAQAEAARAVAERRHVHATEQAVQEALQRYQRGVAVLSSTLQQLQEAGGSGEGAEDRLLASLQAGTRGGDGSCAGMAVEQLVDEILLQVHRRDCEVSSLVAQLAHLEESLSGKARVVAEAETQQQQQQRSLARLKEQLHWCVKETEALKRQLSDRDAELQQLRLRTGGVTRHLGGFGGGSSSSTRWA